MNITNITKKIRITAALALTAAAAALLATPDAKAQASCLIRFGKNMQQVQMNLNQSLTSGTNVAGRTFDYTTNTQGFKFGFECSGPDDARILTNVAVQNGAAVAGTEGPWTYYRVDDYFSIAFSWSDCSGTWYVPVRPFNSFCGTSYTVKSLRDWEQAMIALLNLAGTQWDYGGFMGRVETKWTVRLRVERAFSGPRVINFPNIFRYYYGDVASDAATLQMISLVGNITVPETCSINAGQVIQVDFGDIGAGRFEAAGQKPAGYTPVTTTAPVTCNDAAAQRNVRVSLAATPAAGMSSAIRTSNPDVGIVVQDINDRTVRPNLDTLPLKLTSAGGGRNDGTVTMKAFPVSTTGRKPAIGNFSATAAITVTFD